MSGPISDLRAFLDASPSPFHAAATASVRLDAAGFTRVDLGDDWSTLPDDGYVVRDGAVIGWRAPQSATATTPFRIAGAHTDSPCLRVKPSPDQSAVGWRQLNVEVYGGILNNSWLDRDLGVAGRLTLADGTNVLVDVNRGVARVPQLAVHLDRGVNADGLKLDPQQHLRPVWGTGGGSGRRVRRMDRSRGRLRSAGLLGVVPLRRPAGGGTRGRRVTHRRRPTRQPAVVLGGRRRAGGFDAVERHLP